jgi:hypothetical protein
MICSGSDNSDEGNIARILIFTARSAEEHAVGSRNSWIPSYGSCEDQGELQKVPVEKRTILQSNTRWSYDSLGFINWFVEKQMVNWE